jgi:hypothetical protein
MEPRTLWQSARASSSRTGHPPRIGISARCVYLVMTKLLFYPTLILLGSNAPPVASVGLSTQIGAEAATALSVRRKGEGHSGISILESHDWERRSGPVARHQYRHPLFEGLFNVAHLTPLVVPRHSCDALCSRLTSTPSISHCPSGQACPYSIDFVPDCR